VAEGEGFEPPVPFRGTVVFKTTRFDRSRIPPGRLVSSLAGVGARHQVFRLAREVVNACTSANLAYRSPPAPIPGGSGPEALCRASFGFCRFFFSIFGRSRSFQRT
jgi:hypothetical protein